MRQPLRLFLLPALALCFSSQATLAQTSETGLPPFGSFHGSGLDVVSLENGNLHIEIPIYTVHQRATPDRTYNFVYDIPGWQIDRTPTTPTTFQWTVGQAPHQLSGWHLLDNLVGIWHVDHDIVAKTCTFIPPGGSFPETHSYQVHTNYVLTDTHGTTHPFEVRHVDHTPGEGCTDPIANQNTGVALDGTGYTIAIGANAYNTTISMPNNYGPLNGNSYTTPGISQTNQNDANGNLVTTIWTYSDSNGASQQIRVDYAPVSFQTHFCTILNVGTDPCVEAGVTSQFPQKLTLPTGKFYLFTWSTDGNGDLLRLDLPTGGYIAYTYQTYTKFLGTTYSGGTDGLGRGIGSPSDHYRGRRQVTSRTLSDGTTANTWTYNGGTIHDPLGNDEVHGFTSMGDPPDPPRYETQILYYQGSASSGTLLKTIIKDYASETSTPVSDAIDHGSINVRLSRVTTILENGLQTKTETDYETFQQPPDPTIGFTVTRLNPTEKREYDYGAGAPGALLRRTDFTYLHTGNQNYLSRNIVRQVATTTVYNGSGNQVAQTVNEYDNYSHPGQSMVASNAIQHDSTYGTSFIYRGNRTAVSRWRNTDGALLTTTNQYDDAGNLLSTIDPLGHKTSYDYTDSWANTSCIPTGQAKVFVTKITNALNQFITKSYNSCAATLASVTDLNLKTTTYSYDLMNRLAGVTRPDGGHTSNTYDDTQLLVTSSNLIISAGAAVFSRQHYDQLGRVVQGELCEDGTSACATSIKTDTTYDSMDRLSTVSNPHRTASDSGPTNGTTTTLYDALGRVCVVVPPDGTAVSGNICPTTQPANDVFTAYSGNTTTVTDQAGKSRKSVTDALGRLTQLFEDPAGLNYETDHTYDTLDNLLSVSQKGGSTDSTQWRGRSFTYNSLSQLLSASNPESGKITYTYDAGGNLLTKTSPAPNQTISIGTPGTGSVTISGLQNCRDGCDTGTVSITVNGFTKSTSYGQTSTSTTIATSLASLLNSGSSPVTATSSGRGVNLISKATGTASNYSLSATSHSTVLPDPFFTASPSGSTLTGGTDPPTVTLTFCYDALNRLTAKGYTLQTCTNGTMPSPAVTYSYDQGLASANPIGRRTGMTDSAGSETWTYDSVGRVATDLRTTTGVTKTTSYTYNLDGSVATLTYPSGRTISYTPDAAGRTLSAADTANSINYGTNAHFSPAGALSSLTNGTGISSTYIFNSRLQPCWMYSTTGAALPWNTTNCTGTAATASILDLKYNFSLGTSDNGNVTVITNNRDNTRSQNFTYDSLNRLWTAQTQTTGVTIPNANCWGLTFGYDPWGNQLSSSITGPAGCGEPLPTNFSVASSNRISANTVAGQATNYCYDAPGNLIFITAPATACPTTGPFQYTYNAENQMTLTAGVTYTYDGDGKRIQKSSGTIYWNGMGSDALDETDLNGSTTNASFHEYIFFGGQRIARRDYQNNVNYYFADHLGTSRVSTNSSGSICYDADFYPFGGERIVTDTCDSAYKFTGKERDSESGLDNFGARYFGSAMGRFVTPDSTGYSSLANPQAWNLYAYTLNNPLKYNDPSGHTVECTTNAQQCQAVIAAATANAEAAKRVTTNTVTTKHSFLGIHWTTTKTTIAITGDISSFRALGQNASRLADLVTDSRNIQFGVATSYPENAISFWEKLNDASGKPLNNGGQSLVPSEDQNPAAYVEPDPSHADSEAKSEGIPGANLAETTAHELLGHVWGELAAGHTAYPSGTPGSALNKQDAVKAENAVRATDPSRGQKTKHD